MSTDRGKETYEVGATSRSRGRPAAEGSDATEGRSGITRTLLQEPRAESLAAVRSTRSRVQRRTAIVLTAVILLWFALFAARVLLGDFTITIPDFFRIVFGGAQMPPATFILMESKLPAAVAGTLAGLAFGAGGAAFQTMLRNPLASPDVLGVTLGSSAAAVFALVVLGWSGLSMSLAALVGGLLVAAAINLLAGRDSAATYRMILIGIGVSAGLSSLIQWLLQSTSIYQAQDAMVWLTGSLATIPWAGVARLAVTVAVLLPVLAASLHELRLLELGDDTALALGLDATRLRLTVSVIVVVLCAVATSLTGPIAFIGLLSGPIARRLCGGRPSILVAAFVGAATVVGADYIGTYLIPDTNLPVGVITGIAGAPVLIMLLLKSRATIKDG